MAEPRPHSPERKPRATCAVRSLFSRLPGFLYSGPALLTDARAAAPTSGVVLAETISLAPAGRRPVGLELTGSLALVARGDITITTPIRFPDQTVLGAPNFNLTIVSISGTITIRADIGGGRAAPGADDLTTPAAMTRGRAGVNGGLIQIVGVKVDIRARIEGNGGGSGGDAGPNAPPAAGDTVRAIGGGGGHGGDIFVCATESIRVRAAIVGSAGGGGGEAKVRPDPHGLGRVVGGPAGTQGYVVFAAPAPGCKLLLIGRGSVRPARPQAEGGAATVERGRAPAAAAADEGGDAVARAGQGSDGMVVLIHQNIDVQDLGRLEPGDGGEGGIAVAEGGVGAPGLDGGNAVARGGKGGERGYIGPYTTTAGPHVAQRWGRPGAGGKATALPGSGGSRPAGGVSGGESGWAEAVGGPNGDGVKASSVPRTTPEAPNPRTGQGGIGANAKATAAGAPP